MGVSRTWKSWLSREFRRLRRRRFWRRSCGGGRAPWSWPHRACAQRWFRRRRGFVALHLRAIGAGRGPHRPPAVDRACRPHTGSNPDVDEPRRLVGRTVSLAGHRRRVGRVRPSAPAARTRAAGGHGSCRPRRPRQRPALRGHQRHRRPGRRLLTAHRIQGQTASRRLRVRHPDPAGARLTDLFTARLATGNLASGQPSQPSRSAGVRYRCLRPTAIT